jgi:hypothetical protein
MKLNLLRVAFIFSATAVIISCGGKEKKKEDNKQGTETSVGPEQKENNLVPNIDIDGLKDEASILDAMQKVVDARVADEKKKKEDPSYKGNYLELTKLYTAVLNASTQYSKSIADPAKAVEFGKKVSDIQRKMYE